MMFRTTQLPEVVILTPEIFSDHRGNFREVFCQSEFEDCCGQYSFVQDNMSHSVGGALRGLHYQHIHPQGKLVQAISGQIFDVAVDMRPASPTYGHWVSHILDAELGEQVWIPPGFAHGFYVMSEHADVFYKCTDYYFPGDEACIRWNSPLLAIDWPLSNQFDLVMSDKDRLAPDFVGLP